MELRTMTTKIVIQIPNHGLGSFSNALLDFNVQTILGWSKAAESTRIVSKGQIETVSLGKVVTFLAVGQCWCSLYILNFGVVL